MNVGLKIGMNAGPDRWMMMDKDFSDKEACFTMDELMRQNGRIRRGIKQGGRARQRRFVGQDLNGLRLQTGDNGRALSPNHTQTTQHVR
jgi:hypothetical protein